MKNIFRSTISLTIVTFLGLTACQANPPSSAQTSPEAGLKVLAAESFLSDIAQNVAGDRFQVETLIPRGMDPHAFEPVPRDIVKISECDVLIVNGGGLEEWLQNIIENAGGDHLVIEASKGLQSRPVHEDEEMDHGADETEEGHAHHETDPHFWLDPINVIQYVENIRDGYIQADPEGANIYTKNAEEYIASLSELDSYIQTELQSIPEEKRLIVTNHESFGYFADRYNFKIIGTIVPSVSTGASPSAQQLARLIDDINSSGAIALFLETGTNQQLADQISRETGIRVVTDLYTHSVTPPDGDAPSYIDMMKRNTSTILSALDQ